MAGVFLALDGPDGTGKSTQCRWLVKRLRTSGLTVTEATDPGGTPFGARLRELLLFGRGEGVTLRAEALLFMASRAELVDRVIEPALARGEVVVCDRFVTANVVYQGHAGGLNPAELWRLGLFSSGGVVPHRTLIFDAPLEVLAARRKQAPDLVEQRGTAFHALVRAGFLTEAQARPDTHVVIDATPSVAEVHERVWNAVVDLLPESVR